MIGRDLRTPRNGAKGITITINARHESSKKAAQQAQRMFCSCPSGQACVHRKAEQSRPLGGNEVTGPFGPDRQRWTARYGRAALHCTCMRPRGAMGVGMHELTTPRGSSTGPPASFPAPSISHRLIAVAGRLLIPESFLPRPHGVAYAPGGPRRQNASCHVQFFLNPGARR
jgi:hypothetical protein